MPTQVTECRICRNPRLERVLALGDQMLTGVFPRVAHAEVTVGPLNLVKCIGDGPDVCGLLQMEHSYDLGEMYSDNYGYRSGLNASMVKHLKAKVDRIRSLVTLASGDLVVDIGSNDSTTLRAYDEAGLTLVGIDPTGIKFRDYYPTNVTLIAEFFTADTLRAHFPGRLAKVITSFSMFYDLETPMAFMQQVHDVLADDGIWVFEQSYMPSMLATNSYDTVCHEHLEFYGLKQIKWMTDRVGFVILDVEFNNINGGSFSVTVTKSEAGRATNPAIAAILDREIAEGLDTLVPYQAFAERVDETRRNLRAFLEAAKAEGKTVAALGASTKGNVLLQYCGITTDDIAFVGEVNTEKFGCFTPGTWLPIIPENELLERRPDYLLVLPWHFRAFFEQSETLRDRHLVFPLPELSIR